MQLCEHLSVFILSGQAGGADGGQEVIQNG